MTRCAVCGKRIWSDPVSMPDKPSYHYECAKEVGMLPSRETLKHEIERLVEEIHSDTEVLDKMRNEEVTNVDGTTRLQRLQEKIGYLDSMHKTLARRSKEEWELSRE